MESICQLCKSGLDPNLRASLKGAQTILFCRRCKKRDVLGRATPSEIVLQEERGALFIFQYPVESPLRQLAAGSGLVLGLFFLGIGWSLLTDPTPSDGQRIFGVFSMLLGSFCLLSAVGQYRYRGKLRLSPESTAQESDVPFREGARVGPSIQLFERGLFREHGVVSIESIDQVYCVHESKGSTQFPHLFRVEALLRDGLVVTLMRFIRYLPTAQYVAAQIESFLKLEEGKVSEEANS